MEAPTPHRAPEWGAIHRLCLNETRRILGPGARADDAAQEATIRAWRHWDRRAHSDAVPAWVRTRDRQLRLACYWQELPHAETARRLGLTEATVRVRLHRLHNQLRTLLREPA
jgi:DNA-directed RNA polymerase specialized sigma24 family protein